MSKINQFNKRQDGHSILMNKPHSNTMTKVLTRTDSIDSAPSTPIPKTPTTAPNMNAHGSLDSSPSGSMSPDPAAQELHPELIKAGWKVFWSKREKRPYFFNKMTNESLWETPVLGNAGVRSPSLTDPLGISSTGPPWPNNGQPHVGEKRRSSSGDEFSSAKRPNLNYIPFWNFEIPTNAVIFERPPNLYPQPYPEIEALRASLVIKMRSGYQDMCQSRESIDAPIDSFNRWVLERKVCDEGLDPMLPSICKPEVSQSLFKEIMNDIPFKLEQPSHVGDARKQLFKYANRAREIIENRAESPEGRKLTKCYLDEVYKWLRKESSKYDDYLERLSHLKRKVEPYITDIVRSSVEGICSKLYVQSCEAVKKLYEKHCELLGENNIKLLEETPQVQKRKLACYPIQPALKCPRQPVIEHIIDGDVMYVTYEKDKLLINTPHMHKLEQLYKISCKEDPNYNVFLPRVWCMLRRYQTGFGVNEIEGSALHSALPVPVFECLHRIFGVTFECFASPLNCYFRQYCSAYTDTDCYFGSRGNIFQFYPVSGSFEANPPFCEELMEAMVDHFENLLKDTQDPLSFIIFIPEWRDPPTEALIRLENSDFNREQIVISAMEHDYRQGFQHKCPPKDLVVKSVHGTLVIFLQNDAGFAKWGPTPERVKELERAYTIKDPSGS